MSGTEYHRNDLAVRLRGLPDGSASVNMSHSSSWTSIPAATVSLWKNLPPDGVVPDLVGVLEFEGSLTAWMSDGTRDLPDQRQILWRVTVEIDAPELVHLDWETSLGEALRLSETAVVRTSPVRPRVIATSFNLPLHVLQIGPASYRSIEEFADSVFGGMPRSKDAMQFTRSTWSRVSSTLRQENFRHADVLYFDQYPRLGDTDRLLRTSELRTRGTLGWLARLCDTWEVRLVVINVEDETALAAARRLAAALVARGGPAVLVGDFSDYYAGSTLVASLIHDRPLDDLATLPIRKLRQSLFGGCGREEMLRISKVGLLVSLDKDLNDPKPQATGQWRRDLSDIIHKTSFLGPKLGYAKSRRELVSLSLDSFCVKWDSQVSPEGQGGFLPFNDTLQMITNSWHDDPPPIAWDNMAGFNAKAVMITNSLQSDPNLIRRRVSNLAVGKERYLNASLWQHRADGKLERQEQVSLGRLEVGEVVQLGVQIGLHDPIFSVLGAEPLPEQVFQWQSGVKGRWLEVGITGLDFDVLGDPVQPLWLPRNGPSETVYFAVVPRTSGVARLRFCVYYQNNIVQSCRLAALTVVPSVPEKYYDPTPEERRRILAQALEISPDLVGDVYYLARLEYSLSTDAHSIVQRRPRALSIVVNQLDGQQVLTIKGADAFQEVRTDNTVGDLIQNLRDQLESASAFDPSRPHDTWIYAFDDDTNAGSHDLLKPRLREMANAGWTLYTRLFPQEQGAFRDILAKEGQTIHVAHLLLDKVIPWAAIYDRKVDPKRQSYKNLPVEHDVCMAPLKNGSLQPMKCGEDPQCPLHVQRKMELEQQGKTVIEETVVCPLHFWGFKHIIEIPPQQVPSQSRPQSPGAAPSDLGKPSELQECILVKPALPQSSPKAQFMMCYGPGLNRAETHKDILKVLLADPKKDFKISAEWRQPETQRDAVLDSLEDPDLDLIYLYCHARGGSADPANPSPRLEFGGAVISDPDLYDTKHPWTHHPLVFLNGCRTAGFSPDALSPFITVLVHNRQAAGVVGTEISVFEQLATEVGRVFLEQLLVGASAGEALLYIRRMLLAKGNPLGLAYTLYASADLRLDIDGDGKCG